MSETSRVPMRVLPSIEAVRTFDEVLVGYDRDEAIAEARRALSFDLGQRAAHCPLDVDIPRFVGQVAEGDFDAALATIRSAHPWPEVIGRQCHKFCEFPFNPTGYFMREAAAREDLATPAIGALEWAAGAFGNAALSPFRAGPTTGRRIAVVGAGSAGIACTWELRRRGHDVDIFDREPVPGGLLFTGYPAFRLAKEPVLRENAPAAWGATLHLNHPVDAAELARLVARYDAVFLGLGRAPLRVIGIEGEDLDGVLVGHDVLRATWYGAPPKMGPRVMVVGGGFAAVDVVRTARRLGAPHVEMVYRRGVEEMLRPGSGPFYVGLLAEEGIQCRFLADPSRIVGKDGRVVAVELIKTEYGDPEPESGRRAVQAIEGSIETVPVDTIVFSVGETNDAVQLASTLGAGVNSRGGVDVDPITRQTANPKVWAGGDVIGSNGNEVAAVDGLWAARAIDAFLAGRLDDWRTEAAGNVKDLRF